MDTSHRDRTECVGCDYVSRAVKLSKSVSGRVCVDLIEVIIHLCIFNASRSTFTQETWGVIEQPTSISYY